AATSEHVFVANSSFHQINVISVASNSVIATLNMNDPAGIAADPATNSVYVVDGNARTLNQIRFVAPRFTISVDRQSLAVTPGGNTTINCTVTPIDGFS